MFRFMECIKFCQSKGLIGLLLVSVNLMLITPAFAQTMLQGVTEQFAPYTFEDQNGAAAGIVTEVVQAIVAKAGLNIRIAVYPWARTYKIASEEPNTLIFSIFKTPEREALFHWIGPVIPHVEIGLYKLKERTDIQMHSFEDAKKYLIGVVRDTVFHTYLLEHGFDRKNIDAQADPLQNLKLLFLKRTDLVFADPFENAAQLQHLGLPFDQMEKALSMPEFNTDFYVAISKQTPEDVVQKLQTAFKEIETDGVTIPAILEKYRKQYNIAAPQNP